MNDHTEMLDKKSKLSERGWEKYSLAVYGTVLFFTSIAISGYRLYSANQAVQIPLILSIKNPNLFSNDPFISTLVYYIAPVYRLVAGISHYIPLETLLLILFLATRALILFAAARLALALSPGSKLGAVGAMAFFALVPTTFVGHGTLVVDYFEHTGLSVAFILLALAAFYSSRPYLWALLLATGFYLNVMYGTYACVYLFAAFMLDRHYRTTWKKWILPGVVFLLFTAPVIIQTLSSLGSETVNKELWLQVSEVRMPYHFYPHTWEPYRFNLFFAFVFLSSLVIYSVRQDMGRLYRQGMIWLGVAILWLGYAFFAAYIARSPATIVMQPARGTDLWFAFASIATIVSFVHLIESKTDIKKFFIVLYFVCIFWIVFFEFPLYLEFVILLLTIGVIWEPLWVHMFKKGEMIRLAQIAVLNVVLVAGLTISLKYYSNRVITIASYPGSQIQDIAAWSKANTAIGDVFLVDPNWSEFRALSERPVFVTWKDGSAIHWQRSYVEEWVPRIEAFGFDFKTADQAGTPEGFPLISRLYKNLNDQKVHELTSQYPIQYWVVPVDFPSSYPLVFQSSGYKVLELSPLGQK